MIESIDPMSYENLEKILKYLPEPNEVEVILFNFDHSNVHKQASELYKELKLKPLGHQSLKATLENPSKDKILKICKLERESKEENRKVVDVNKYDPRFIYFEKAEWRTDGIIIDLDHFELNIRCMDEVPNYINRMSRELKDTFVRYKIVQTPYLY